MSDDAPEFPPYIGVSDVTAASHEQMVVEALAVAP